MSEIKDDLVFAAFARWFDKADHPDTFSIHEEGVHAAYIEELSIFATDLLNEPAEKRQQLINEKNLDLYRREIERLEQPNKDGLDAAHKQYLQRLRKQFNAYKKTKELERLQDAVRRDPNVFSFEELEEVTKTERELGVHKKIRELRRLKNLAPNKLTTNKQNEYLAALEKDIEEDKAELVRIEQSGQSNSPGENAKKKERLEYLLSELDLDSGPTEARLRPISSLQPDVPTTLDFTCFDRMIKETCLLANAKALTGKRRDQIVREIFVHEFQRIYLPAMFTSVELDALASINNDD